MISSTSLSYAIKSLTPLILLILSCIYVQRQRVNIGKASTSLKLVAAPCGVIKPRFSGPLVDNHKLYYNIAFPPKCVPLRVGTNKKPSIRSIPSWDFDALNQIVTHWQHTLPQGILPVYPE